MRPRLDAAHQRLQPVLGRLGPSKGTDLARALRVSQASVLRFLQEACTEVVQSGQARRQRYAARRGLRGNLSPMPVYAVAEDGRVSQAGELALVQPQGSWLTLVGSGWPVPPENAVGW